MECRLQTNAKPNICSQPAWTDHRKFQPDKYVIFYFSLSLSRLAFSWHVAQNPTKFCFSQRHLSVVPVATNYMNARVTCDQLNNEYCIFVQMWTTSSTLFSDLAEILKLQNQFDVSCVKCDSVSFGIPFSFPQKVCRWKASTGEIQLAVGNLSIKIFNPIRWWYNTNTRDFRSGRLARINCVMFDWENCDWQVFLERHSPVSINCVWRCEFIRKIQIKTSRIFCNSFQFFFTFHDVISS